jgi:hypothetical protein
MAQTIDGPATINGALDVGGDLLVGGVNSTHPNIIATGDITAFTVVRCARLVPLQGVQNTIAVAGGFVTEGNLVAERDLVVGGVPLRGAENTITVVGGFVTEGNAIMAGTLTVASLAPPANANPPHTIKVQGGVACDGNVALTAGDVIVRGQALLAAIETLQTEVNRLQTQVNTAINNLTGRVSVVEVEISNLQAKVGG